MGTIFVDNIKNNVGGKKLNIGDSSINVDDAGAVTINEGSIDADFRVESDGNANMLFVDAGNNRIGIGNGSPSDDFELTPSADEKGITLKTTSSIRPYLNFDANRSGASNTIARIQGKWNGTTVTRIELIAGSDTTNKDDGLIAFQTASSSSDINERMRIDNSGNVSIGKTSTNAANAGVAFEPDGVILSTHDGDVCAIFNRNTNDGRVIDIRQANTLEGSIDVSGSSVSLSGFSGTHESSGIATDTPIGTVVSTIDELDVYSTKQGENGREEDCPKAGQTRADHAKVKISDSIGDKRVYGVVNSFNAQGKVNVASVGIASIKVTGACEGGDLLESNGDGTAKVQSDDIVRSKTLGKVTIGNSNTGVKLVSCVLYCG